MWGFLMQGSHLVKNIAYQAFVVQLLAKLMYIYH